MAVAKKSTAEAPIRTRSVFVTTTTSRIESGQYSTDSTGQWTRKEDAEFEIKNPTINGVMAWLSSIADKYADGGNCKVSFDSDYWDDEVTVRVEGKLYVTEAQIEFCEKQWAADEAKRKVQAEKAKVAAAKRAATAKANKEKEEQKQIATAEALLRKKRPELFAPETTS